MRREIRIPQNTCWHRWWAWHPITITWLDGCHQITKLVWLDYVWRRKHYDFWGDGWWEYSFEQDKPAE